MDGYGFPPALAPLPLRDGWFRTSDLGRLDEAGALWLTGRADDTVRTAAGHLVNLAEVARVAREHPGVRDAAAVPLDDGAGVHLGLLVEADAGLSPAGLRRHLAAALPPWARPRVVEATASLPRLPVGKPDRDACAAVLRQAR
jgi:acyl-CoA synthetase (AMP-forming)/AMP-acid ligase II